MENLLLSLPDVFNYLLVSKAIHGSILSTRFSIYHLVMRQVIFSSYPTSAGYQPHLCLLAVASFNLSLCETMSNKPY